MYTLIMLLLLSSSVYAQESQIKAIPATGQMFGLELSPDEQTIAIFENTALHMDEIIDDYLPIRLINLADGSQKAAFTGATDYATDVAFAPDGTVAASYHSNGYIYLWDTADGSTIKRIDAIPGSGSLQFLPDGKQLAVVLNGSLGQILLWDTETGYVQHIFMQRFATIAEWKDLNFRGTGGPEYYSGFDVKPDGSRAAVVTGHGNIWLWDFASGEDRLIRQSGEEAPRFNIRNLSFSPDGDSLVYLNIDEDIINVLDIEMGSETPIVSAPDALEFGVSPDGTMVAWITEEAVFVSPLQADADPQAFELPLPDNFRVGGPQLFMKFTSDNSQLIVGGFANVNSGDNLIYVITL